MKSISFEGYSSGDWECYCWDVSADEYKRITKDEEVWQRRSRVRDDMVRLYPTDILNALEVDNKKKYKFTLTVEEIKDGS